MSAAELAQAKLSSPCRKCGKLGHWGDAHYPDGSRKPGTPSFDPQNVNVSTNNQQSPSQNVNAQSDGNNSNSQKQPPIIGFMANVSNSIDEDQSPSNTVIYASSSCTRTSRIGPMVDDGAPFSAIGEVELRYHRKRLVGGEIKFDEIPPDLGDAEFWQFGVCAHASPRRRIL